MHGRGLLDTCGIGVCERPQPVRATVSANEVYQYQYRTVYVTISGGSVGCCLELGTGVARVL